MLAKSSLFAFCSPSTCCRSLSFSVVLASSAAIRNWNDCASSFAAVRLAWSSAFALCKAFICSMLVEVSFSLSAWLLSSVAICEWNSCACCSAAARLAWSSVFAASNAFIRS